MTGVCIKLLLKETTKQRQVFHDRLSINVFVKLLHPPCRLPRFLQLSTLLSYFNNLFSLHLPNAKLVNMWLYISLMYQILYLPALIHTPSHSFQDKCRDI